MIFKQEYEELINSYQRPFFFRAFLKDSHEKIMEINTGKDILEIPQEKHTIKTTAVNDLFNANKTPQGQSFQIKDKIKKNTF